MAAVLVNACGEICNGACDVCGAVCKLPFKACNTLCAGCGNVCEHFCHSLGQMCTSPFSIYVTVAAVFNIPSVYIGLANAIDGEGVACQGSRWLFFNALFGIINVMAAIYMARIVVQQDAPDIHDIETPTKKKPTTAFGRAGHLLCYDPWMALYILVLLAFFIWLWTGAIWSLNGNIDQNCSDESSVQGKVAIALGFGWAFFFFGVAALMIGLCCAYCYQDSTTTTTGVSATQYSFYQETTTAFFPSSTTGGKKVGAGTATVEPTAPSAPSKPESATPMAQAVLF